MWIFYYGIWQSLWTIDLHVRRTYRAIVDLVKNDGQFITFVQSSERQDFTEMKKSRRETDLISYNFWQERFSAENFSFLKINISPQMLGLLWTKIFSILSIPQPVKNRCCWAMTLDFPRTIRHISQE